MKTGIYARVSTEEQAREGFSIRAQQEKLRDYARLKDWQVQDIYIDEGISGKNIQERPALNRLLKDIENGKVHNILVFKVDRLTRSTKDLITLVEFFNEHHCAFNSFMESIDTDSATGRMFLKIIGIFAEFERENLIERVKVGFERKVKEGYSLCALTPSYGYSRPKGQKVQTIYEPEAIIVKEIFDLFVNQNCTITNISIQLNKRGIPTKMGAIWNTKTIRLILQNPNYIGKVRYKCNDAANYMEVEGIHEPIIDPDVYYNAQAKIKHKKRLGITKRPKEDAYFARIAECEICGSKLSPRYSYGKMLADGTPIEYRAYRCIKSVRGMCHFSCSHRLLEQAFQDYLDSIEDITVANEVDNTEEKRIKQLEKEKKLLTAEYEVLENKAKEIMELYVSQHLCFDDYKNTLELINEKKQTVEIKLNTLTIPEQPIYSEKDILRNLKENWKYLNNIERMEFLQKFIKRIVVHAEKRGTKYYDISLPIVEFNEF